MSDEALITLFVMVILNLLLSALALARGVVNSEWLELISEMVVTRKETDR